MYASIFGRGFALLSWRSRKPKETVLIDSWYRRLRGEEAYDLLWGEAVPKCRQRGGSFHGLAVPPVMFDRLGAASGSIGDIPRDRSSGPSA